MIHRLTALWVLVLTGPLVAADAPVLFNRDIRPIFSDTCFKCHGPDSAAREADLRLDTEEGAFARRGRITPIVPGDPAASEAYRRIVSSDPVEMMPPPDSHLELSAAQKALIRRWIEQGAHYETHWSLTPPQRPSVPVVRDLLWPGNAIDRFILARLEHEGLRPSPGADKATLIRRVHLALTGLPPDMADLQAALDDAADDWYERLVDRLLDTSRYGERMARPWLDASRYADTNGYQVDTARDMWLWREWVIAAYNHNMPFDRFTIEQLAGDLLSGATIDQRIASGFNRNHRINGEGGIIPEEFLVEYVVDRVDTTGTVWMGLTLGCARCHDHKYDPISQEDFYRLYAFFNNVPEKGADGLGGPSTPFLRVKTPEHAAKIDAVVAQWAGLKKRMKELEPQVQAAQARWEQSQASGIELPSQGLLASLELDGPPPATGASPLYTFKAGEAAYAASPLGQAADFDGQRYIEAGDIAGFERDEAFSFGAWVYTYPETNGAVIARMDDNNDYRGYNLFIASGAVIVQLISKFPEDSMVLNTGPVLKAQQWHHVFATYDGSGAAKGLRVYVDGEPAPGMPVGAVTGSMTNSVPLTIGSRTPGSRFKGRIAGVRIYRGVLPADQVSALAGGQLTAPILAIRAQERTAEQKASLREFYLNHHSPAEYRQALRKSRALERQRKNLEQNLPSTMVMQEMEQPRDTFVLMRGEYDKPGGKVLPGVPASLPPLPAGEPANRLTLARWLVSGEHPLTGRVAVNRFWQELFGEGLVRTTEDFGSQGQWPTHPELLDWLATEYVRIGWDTKAMIRLIVTSATFRQSSKLTPQLAERDPGNELLARGPRFRMPAEVIRDSALAASGLLVEQIGGPSVKPYQPPRLWEELTTPGFSANTYEQDKGDKLFRRSLYTYWKRTIPPPGLAIFDAPSREVCIVRRQRTNTPMQALALMNDVIYVEAARHLAQRMIREGGATPAERLSHGLRLVAARLPRDAELKVLTGALRRHLAEFRASPSETQRLLFIGESPRDESLDAAEHAAYTVLANLILNLDEAITRE